MSTRVEQRLREILRERREGRAHVPIDGHESSGVDTIAEARRPDRLRQGCGESAEASAKAEGAKVLRE